MYPDQPQLSDAAAEKRSAANYDAYQNAKGSRFHRDYGTPAHQKRNDENYREVDTHDAVMFDAPVSVLEAAAKKGHPTEVSGDALARAKKGQTPKIVY